MKNILGPLKLTFALDHKDHSYSKLTAITNKLIDIYMYASNEPWTVITMSWLQWRNIDGHKEFIITRIGCELFPTYNLVWI